MKKFFIRLIILVVILLILAVVVVGLFLDRAIKAGVETVGSRLTGVSVQVESVSLSFWSGKGSVQGLVVGNPEGFKAPTAMKVAAASVAVDTRSLLSDKIVIKSIVLES